MEADGSNAAPWQAMALCNTPIASGGASARDMRERTLIRATMFGDRMPQQDIIIRNASPYGIGAVTRGIMPEAGEAVIVTLPDGEEISGMVRWINDKAFGVQLDDLLNVRLLKLATHRRNEDFGKAIDWMVDLRFRKPEIEQDLQQANLRHL